MSATLYTASSPSPARHAGRGSAECTRAEGPVNLRHRKCRAQSAGPMRTQRICAYVQYACRNISPSLICLIFLFSNLRWFRVHDC